MTELVAALTDTIRAAGRKLGIEKETVESLAGVVIEALRRSHGGERYYLPAAVDERRAEALKMIRAGKTPAEAARRLRVDISTIYRWMQRERQRNQAQPPRRGLEPDDWRPL